MGDAARKPFKEYLDAEAVDRLIAAVSAAWPAFNAAGFRRAALTGLDALELTPRVAHIGAALRGHLPPDFPATAAVLQRIASHWPAPAPGDSAGAFAAWPLFHVVPAAGLDHFDLGMETLRRLTPLFSAEGVIRPFIDRYGPRAFERLHVWIGDPNPHVRRLVSEGTRPRLPWAPRVRRLLDEPEAGLALLDRLVDDEDLYVRRSVANHLNDVSRDHPDLAVAAARRWLERPNPRRLWVVKHALRSLVKAGHPEVFELLGHDAAPSFEAGPLQVAPVRVPFGGRVTFGARLTSTAASATPWVVDFEVGFMGARGQSRRKVFKGTSATLPPGASRDFEFTHDFRPITTRRYYPGAHTVALLINGRVAASGAFELLAP